jgi:hypothetical protein
MASVVKHGPLVAAAQTLRIQGLRHIDAALTDPETVELAIFVDALGATLLLDVTAAKIARRADVATATITRWGQGFHSPHHLMLPSIVKAMREVIAEEIDIASAYLQARSLKAA